MHEDVRSTGPAHPETTRLTSVVKVTVGVGSPVVVDVVTVLVSAACLEYCVNSDVRVTEVVSAGFTKI